MTTVLSQKLACIKMESLLSFLMGEIIVIAVLFLLNEASEVIYYVTVNNDGVNWQCPAGQCFISTLQDFVENIGITTRRSENDNTMLTMLFMPGTHNVNFMAKVNITAPARLILIGLNHSKVIVRANRACHLPDISIVECGLFFEHVSVTIVSHSTVFQLS